MRSFSLTLNIAAGLGGIVNAPLRAAVRKFYLAAGGCKSIKACPVSGKKASSITKDKIDFSNLSATPEITMPP
jgi:hypothetical protein